MYRVTSELQQVAGIYHQSALKAQCKTRKRSVVRRNSRLPKSAQRPAAPHVGRMPLSLIAGYHLAHSRLGTDLQLDDGAESASGSSQQLLSPASSPALDAVGETLPLPRELESQDEQRGIGDADESMVESCVSLNENALWTMLDEEVQAELDAEDTATADSSPMPQVASPMLQLEIAVRARHGVYKAGMRRVSSLSKVRRHKPSAWRAAIHLRSPRNTPGSASASDSSICSS